MNVTQSPCFVKRTLKHAACMLSLLSHLQLFATLVAHQFPLSMGFSRQEYWSGLQFPSLEDLPNTGIEIGSPALQADSLPTEATREARIESLPVYNPGPLADQGARPTLYETIRVIHSKLS